MSGEELRAALAEWDAIEGSSLTDQFRGFIAAGKMADAIRAALAAPSTPEPSGPCHCTPDQFQGHGHGVNCPQYRAAPSTEPALDVEIAAEAARARAKFGDQRDFTDGDWLAVLTEEVGEAATETLRAKLFDPAGLFRRSNESGVPVEESDFPVARLRTELVQVAAVARRWIVALDDRLAESQPIKETR